MSAMLEAESTLDVALHNTDTEKQESIVQLLLFGKKETWFQDYCKVCFAHSILIAKRDLKLSVKLGEGAGLHEKPFGLHKARFCHWHFSRFITLI